jgi:hypothetical protein
MLLQYFYKKDIENKDIENKQYLLVLSYAFDFSMYFISDF